MRLNEWIATQPLGAKAELARAVGVGWNVIHYLCTGEHCARYALAVKICAHTNGDVSVRELCEPVTARKRARAKAKRARKSAKRKRPSRPAPAAQAI